MTPPLLPEERDHYHWLVWGLLEGVRRQLANGGKPTEAAGEALDHVGEAFDDVLARATPTALARPAMAGETFAERLRRLRLAAGLSQRELAEPGVSYAYISRLEAGTRTASVKAIRKLAPKLGVSADYLETGVEPDPDEEVNALRELLAIEQVATAVAARQYVIWRDRAERLQARLDEVSEASAARWLREQAEGQEENGRQEGAKVLQLAESRRPDSNRGPHHYECWWDDRPWPPQAA